MVTGLPNLISVINNRVEAGKICKDPAIPETWPDMKGVKLSLLLARSHCQASHMLKYSDWRRTLQTGSYYS
jgi:hypothetical protein